MAEFSSQANLEVEKNHGNALSAMPADQLSATCKILETLHQTHMDSLKRNRDDLDRDRAASQGDRESITLAGKTAQTIDELRQYLADGGDFRDNRGLSLGQKAILSLRKQHDDCAEDRKVDLQYAGKTGVPQNFADSIVLDSVRIEHGAVEFLRRDISDTSRFEMLKSIDASARAIRDSAGKAGPGSGKDLEDAFGESKVISADVEAMLHGNLTSSEKRLVSDDIIAKSKLIQNELQDAPNEFKYAQHDSQLIKAGGDLEAVIRSGMETHSARTIKQLAQLLESYRNSSGSGRLDAVLADRNEDLALEQGYMNANYADNYEHNAQIMEFTNPY